jgi:hypothetical protein
MVKVKDNLNDPLLERFRAGRDAANEGKFGPRLDDLNDQELRALLFGQRSRKLSDKLSAFFCNLWKKK